MEVKNRDGVTSFAYMSSSWLSRFWNASATSLISSLVESPVERPPLSTRSLYGAHTSVR
jgi:hypothetical protein